MERRERYDPEDIESLLSERSFDELLDEERDFVLRHLSGREEYEQMRALLHYVRPDEGMRAPIEADDRVRSNVMAVFRAQQRPQWQIWLNSLAAWLKPEAPSGFYRPALAFGTVALLIVAGVFAVRQFSRNPENATLAEVHDVKSLAKEESQPPATGDTNGTERNERAAVAEPQAALESESTGAVREENVVRTDAVADFDLDQSSSSSSAGEAAKLPPVPGAPAVEDLAAAQDEDMVTKFTPATTTTSSTAAPSTGHVVTMNELAKNESRANVSDVVVSSGSKRKRSTTKEIADEKAGLDITVSRSMAQDPALLGLISSGW